MTAPFALLGSLFGGGPQLSYIDFPAGLRDADGGADAEAAQLSKALVERPQVKLDIPLHTTGRCDDQALEQAALEQALAAQPAPLAAGQAARASAQPARTAGAAQRVSRSSADAGVPAARARRRALRPHAVTALSRSRIRHDAPSARAGHRRSASVAGAAVAAAFAPTREQRDAPGQARAEAVQAAVLANAELQPERVFLTNESLGRRTGRIGAHGTEAAVARR